MQYNLNSKHPHPQAKITCEPPLSWTICTLHFQSNSHWTIIIILDLPPIQLHSRTITMDIWASVRPRASLSIQLSTWFFLNHSYINHWVAEPLLSLPHSPSIRIAGVILYLHNRQVEGSQVWERHHLHPTSWLPEQNHLHTLFIIMMRCADPVNANDFLLYPLCSSSKVTQVFCNKCWI